MRDHPLAYFLTWSCKGTWLHGDERGSVDPQHNTFETPRLPSDPARERSEAERANEPLLLLDPQARAVVRDTVKAHCTHRNWGLLAINVRTNHVHVVVHNHGPSPEDMMDQFKAWTTRRLREAGLIAADYRPWTRHGSTVYLWRQDKVAEKVHYVLYEQGPDL